MTFGWVFGGQLGLRQTQALINTKTIRRGRVPPAILLLHGLLMRPYGELFLRFLCMGNPVNYKKNGTFWSFQNTYRIASWFIRKKAAKSAAFLNFKQAVVKSSVKSFVKPLVKPCVTPCVKFLTSGPSPNPLFFQKKTINVQTYKGNPCKNNPNKKKSPFRFMNESKVNPLKF